MIHLAPLHCKMHIAPLQCTVHYLYTTSHHCTSWCTLHNAHCSAKCTPPRTTALLDAVHNTHCTVYTTSHHYTARCTLHDAVHSAHCTVCTTSQHCAEWCTHGTPPPHMVHLHMLYTYKHGTPPHTTPPRCMVHRTEHFTAS